METINKEDEEPTPELSTYPDPPVNKAQQNPPTMETQVGIKAIIPLNEKMKDVLIKIYHANDTMHTDQTGCFPTMSSSGNQHIMVLVEIDGNYIGQSH